MKVGTDSLILGSWALAIDQAQHSNEQQINTLDIGCGTGLLTLMLAQKLITAGASAVADKVCQLFQFTAVEIDTGACIDAELNFANSRWADNIQLIKSPIQALADGIKYQRIICNPPYFGAGQIIEKNRELARLQSRLDWQTLAQQISQRLAVNGIAELVFPFVDLAYVKAIFAEHNLTCIAELHVFPKVTDEVAKRVCIRVKLASGCCDEFLAPEAEKLVIYNDANKYTEQYRALCRAYYLNF